jgi:tRNA/tmRNA/rRNA uracil-C5-methylase (TrmA/RlmC/RlmD family)
VHLTSGQKITLTIHDIAFGGEGVGRVEDFVVFVPFVLVGEEVEAEIFEIKKNFARAKLLSVLKPSAERVEPPCPYFGSCGGCQYQHIAYEAQLRFKHKQIADLFQRIGGITKDVVAPVVPCPQPYGYRNRIMIRSQWNKPEQKLNIGFVRWDGGLVEDIEECKIAEPPLNGEIKHVRAHPPPKGGIKIVLRIPPENWDVPRDSFFQNNFFLLPKMVETVRGFLRDAGCSAAVPAAGSSTVSVRDSAAGGMTPPQTTGKDVCATLRRHLIDLYCGVGFFGIELAEAVESFVGVEYDQLAIKAARHNAVLHQRTNGEFISAKVEEALPSLIKKFSAEHTTVLLDPPRKGCTPETLQLLRETKPSQIIYISCHPGTMARDLNVLCAEGVFELMKVVPLDMFPQTQHVECVADLRRERQ